MELYMFQNFTVTKKFLFVSEFFLTLTFYMKVSCRISDVRVIGEHGKLFPERE